MNVGRILTSQTLVPSQSLKLPPSRPREDSFLSNVNNARHLVTETEIATEIATEIEIATFARSVGQSSKLPRRSRSPLFPL